MRTDAEKARAFYDYVVKNVRYDKQGTGWEARMRMKTLLHSFLAATVLVASNVRAAPPLQSRLISALAHDLGSQLPHFRTIKLVPNAPKRRM